MDALKDTLDNELVYTAVFIDCDEDEGRYDSILKALGIERDDVIDEKSPLIYTHEDLPTNGSVTIQYRAGKPEVESDSDEEE